MRLFTFACPMCVADRQRFSILSALARRPKKLCRGCGIVLRSRPSMGVYLLFLLYTQFIGLIAGLSADMGLHGAAMDGDGSALCSCASAMPRTSDGDTCARNRCDKVKPDRSYARAKMKASKHDP